MVESKHDFMLLLKVFMHTKCACDAFSTLLLFAKYSAHARRCAGVTFLVANVYLTNKFSRTLKMHDLPFNKGMRK